MIRAEDVVASDTTAGVGIIMAACVGGSKRLAAGPLALEVFSDCGLLIPARFNCLDSGHNNT